VFWNEKDRFLKLNLPLTIHCEKFLGQTAFGYHVLPKNGDEAVAQKWIAVNSATNSLTCINDGVYASSFNDGSLWLSLLRSPAYSGHPICDRPIVPQNRFTPRIDQGERIFHFWINAGALQDRIKSIDRESLVNNEKPFALSFFPPGSRKIPSEFCRIGGNSVQLVSAKPAEKDGILLLRFFEPAGIKTEAIIEFPFSKFRKKIMFTPHEFKTFSFDTRRNKLIEKDGLS
jgi:alpha-mannosidase